MKKTNQEITKLSKKELCIYITEITQTEICKDKKYCNFLTKRLLEIKK